MFIKNIFWKIQDIICAERQLESINQNVTVDAVQLSTQEGSVSSVTF